MERILNQVLSKMTEEEFQLSDDQKEFVKKLIGKGFVSASTALNQLLGTSVDITLPELEIFSGENLSKYIDQNEVVLGVILRVLGDFEGTLFCIFKKDDTHKMLTLLYEDLPQSKKEIVLTDDFEVSTIKEVANILAGAYLSSLSKFLAPNLIPSIPHLVLDSAAAAFDLGLDSEKSNMLLVKSNLKLQRGDINILGCLVLQLNKDQFKQLYSAIVKKHKEEKA